MRLPIIQGTIDRRILANYRIEPTVIGSLLPSPFRPQLVRGYAIGGICLIRLVGMRPRFCPVPLGPSSEHAAHRIAVEWDDEGSTRTGVYVPRRDTSSRLHAWAGGRLFPGVQKHAQFRILEFGDYFSVEMAGDDGETHVCVKGQLSAAWPSSSVFPSLKEASSFFEQGSLGYSATDRPGEFDGMELQCRNWSVEPLAVEEIASSFFDDTTQFPEGTVAFDHALLMRQIQHRWVGQKDLCCAAAPAG